VEEIPEQRSDRLWPLHNTWYSAEGTLIATLLVAHTLVFMRNLIQITGENIVDDTSSRLLFQKQL
jgi:hypothetical protein